MRLEAKDMKKTKTFHVTNHTDMALLPFFFSLRSHWTQTSWAIGDSQGKAGAGLEEGGAGVRFNKGGKGCLVVICLGHI